MQLFRQLVHLYVFSNGTIVYELLQIFVIVVVFSVDFILPKYVNVYLYCRHKRVCEQSLPA